MIKNTLKINNPLTIIAVFSMLTEASAAVSLPYIDSAHQKEYVWFLIIFPVLLITLFFLTLNFNNKTLYTPADLSKAALPLTMTSYSPRTYPHNRTGTSLATPPYQPGITFSSFPPQNFTFLPQGHRIYDSDTKETPELNNPPNPLLYKSAAHEILHSHSTSVRKFKINNRTSDVLLLLTSTPPDITPETSKQDIDCYKNTSPYDSKILITYHPGTGSTETIQLTFRAL